MFSIYIDNLYQKLCHILQSRSYWWHKPLKYGLNNLYYVFCTWLSQPYDCHRVPFLCWSDILVPGVLFCHAHAWMIAAGCWCSYCQNTQHRFEFHRRDALLRGPLDNNWCRLDMQWRCWYKAQGLLRATDENYRCWSGELPYNNADLIYKETITNSRIVSSLKLIAK